VGDPLAGKVDRRDRPGPAQQGGGPSSGELAGGAAGVQLSQQHVQPAQGSGAFGDQVITAVR
jgi:hypothetical protein